MAKRKKQIQATIPLEKVEEIQKAYENELEKNPKYSLLVDPDNKYKMTELQKKFVEYYVQFKNVLTVANIMKIKQDDANDIFLSYPVQNEIRRINLALYHRQFSAKMISLDEIGGYLTSLLTGENTSLADLPRDLDDRLAVLKLLIEVNKLKSAAIEDPSNVMNKNITDDFKQLSVVTIKQMLSIEEDTNIKNRLISETGKGLTPEESAYLSTLPTEQLIEIIESTNKENNKNGRDNKDKAIHISKGK